MSDQHFPGSAPVDDPRLVNFDLGPLGHLKLDSIRPTALRAGRLAAALLRVPEADMIAVQGGRVWRAKGAGDNTDDAGAKLIALKAGDPFWIADTWLDKDWCRHPNVRAGHQIRFCAAAPVRLRTGELLGALRVFDVNPRAHDAELAAGLGDLADFIADGCDRLLGSEVRRIRELFDKAPGFMAVLTGPDHVIELINVTGQAFVGQREVVGRPMRAALPELEAQGLPKIFDEVYASGESYTARAAKVRLRRAAGRAKETAYADFVLQPIVGAGRTVTGVFCQGIDVTREKLAADELEAGRLQLEAALSATQTIFDHSLDVICTIDAAGRFTKVSRNAESLWGFAAEELVGRRHTELVHPEDVAATWDISAQIMSGVPSRGFANRCLHRDGTSVPMMWSAVWSEVHQTTFAVARDMREQQAAEEKLRQAQKMEAVGQLTGGIAHDFNNLLTIVIGSAEVLSESLATRPELESLAQLVLDAAGRGADLVNRLLAFSRQHALVPQSVDCADLFRTLAPLLQRTIGSEIHITFDAPTELYCIADPSQLTSALLNLSLNARDAMSKGGRLTISARLELPEVAGSDGGMVVLTVHDTGEGMTEGVLERVLEPFYTTKAVGKGSGLGLSMVYGFATQSGGRLEIASELSVGTSVKLYLPACAQAIASAERAVEKVTAALVARHILVVEDDELLRRQVERQLVGLGYRVSTREDGPSGLEALTEIRDIDLLMTDIVMPGGLNGRQLAERAQAMLPDLRTLFTSGFSGHASLSAELLERADFLAKPYRRADLARKLELVFGSAP